MLAEFASVLALLAYSQDTPSAPVPGEPSTRVGDIDVHWRPDTILCVRAERPAGSRIQGSGDCRSIAEWRTVQVARAERYRILLTHLGNYSMDSNLEEEALGQTVRITLKEPTGR